MQYGLNKQLFYFFFYKEVQSHICDIWQLTEFVMLIFSAVDSGVPINCVGWQ